MPLSSDTKHKATVCYTLSPWIKPEPENTRLAVKLSSRIVDKCQIYKSKAGDIGHYYFKKS